MATDRDSKIRGGGGGGGAKDLDDDSEGFSGTFLIAAPASFKTESAASDHRAMISHPTPSSTPRAPRGIISSSGTSQRGTPASCRLLPLWQRIFRLRRSAGKGGKSKKLRNVSESDEAPHYGTKPGHFDTLKIHFPTSEGVSEVSERANE